MKVPNPLSIWLIRLGCFFPSSFPTSSSSLLGLAVADSVAVQIHKLDRNIGNSNGITQATNGADARMLLQSIGNKGLNNTGQYALATDHMYNRAATTAENAQPRSRRTRSQRMSRGSKPRSRSHRYYHDRNNDNPAPIHDHRDGDRKRASPTRKYPVKGTRRQPSYNIPTWHHMQKFNADHKPTSHRRPTPRRPTPRRPTPRRPTPKPVRQPRTPKLARRRPPPTRRPPVHPYVPISRLPNRFVRPVLLLNQHC